MTRRLENLIAFQAGWTGCVLSAAHGLPVAGLLIAGLVTGFHVWRSDKPSSALKLIACAAALGTVADSLLLATGWLSYSSGQPLASVAPYWIIAMWAMFATTLDESLAWLGRSRLIAGVAGALFAPLAYWTGARLGAIRLLEPQPALLAVAAAWALALPALTRLARSLPSSAQRAAASPGLADHA